MGSRQLNSAFDTYVVLVEKGSLPHFGLRLKQVWLKCAYFEKLNNLDSYNIKFDAMVLLRQYFCYVRPELEI